MSGVPGPDLSVVVPVHDGVAVLARSLPALAASDLPRQAWELIVVDDASTDDTARLAEAHADAVIRLDGPPRGPAFARNRGAAAANGDVIVFVDADVCIRPDGLRLFRETLRDEPGVCAVFGAYDTRPAAPGLISQYRNLVHHRVHAEHAGDAETFWAGCGAIRRTAFRRADGFDAARYPRPQIEDIELGYRLRGLGCRILVRPDIQGTHLKRWTLRGMIVNDVRDRGIPWMRLLLEGASAGRGTLNIRWEERLMTAAAALAVLALFAAPFVAGRALVALAAACALLIVVLNMPLLRWFARVRGVGFALATVPLRLLYYALNAVSGSVAVVQHVISLARRHPAEPAGAHDPRHAGRANTDPPAPERTP
ncbi:MAG TPA: glycosyltransferase [Longimicrobiales bacterium]|nr:glycosyltransferase [Longimicrobiales bacterium]